jgi:hypothetical protein
VYDSRVSQLIAIANNQSVTIPRRGSKKTRAHVRTTTKSDLRQRRSTQSPNLSPKPVKSKTTRSALVRMMERRKPRQRKSIPSPKLLQTHDTLSASHFSFGFSYDLTCIVRGCTSRLAFAWDG